MKLESSHHSKIEEIITLLELSNDCTIAFVNCNEPILCNLVCDEILERVGDRIYIDKLRMDEDSTNLFHLLKEKAELDAYKFNKSQNKIVAVFVLGFDKAIRKKNKNGKSETLFLLNMLRENLLEFEYPIIIWINNSSLKLILKEAPDFFSWRTTVFDF
ncbi:MULTISPECIES: hypothetical protein [unclassified Methanosarcina]|uniref:hypothetical protein n=1 Tax=unclassified Methanosarcina TaxID=2644672 RepID=UPI00064F1908|nr:MULTISPECIES: hypothetical protein [unclassified Methanosarcina]